MNTKAPASLFLFAHQDDESGVFQAIKDAIKAGHHVCCAYFTSGMFNGLSAQKRNHESLAVLSQLGVGEEEVCFVGQQLAIDDASLPYNLNRAGQWLQQWVASFSDVSSIYVTAWEGGHHDHDALHALTCLVAEDLGLLRCVRQFSLYNAYQCPGPLFKVFSPLAGNGICEKSYISWKSRCRYMRYCLSYPSQLKTWLGLFPLVFLKYVFIGQQILQPVSLERLKERPHNGPLYYEKRKFFTWRKMQECLALFSLEGSDSKKQKNS